MINSACDGSQIETMCCDGEIYACMHDFWVPTECYTKCFADECDIICTAETEHYPTGGCQYRFSPQSVCNDGFISFPYTSSSSCEFLLSMCGNSIVEEIYEQCDDGNTVDGDGCSATCRSETNEPEQTECPVDGGNCTELWENMCCNGKVFFCDMDNKWHAQTCLTGTECDTIHADFGVG
ncbi:MAG: DUF4215 domain-containing protein, partial [Proteobacteria bacterium]|nr:DUF4215 domain-containing protein [Pseudomonadota bacterium]